jgi:hypothetical protein
MLRTVQRYEGTFVPLHRGMCVFVCSNVTTKPRSCITTKDRKLFSRTVCFPFRTS